MEKGEDSGLKHGFKLVLPEGRVVLDRHWRLSKQAWCGLIVLLLLVSPVVGAEQRNTGNSTEPVNSTIAVIKLLPAPEKQLTPGSVTLAPAPVTQQGPILSGVLVGGGTLAVAFVYDADIANMLQASAPDKASLMPQAVSFMASEAGMAVTHALLYTQNKELALRSARAVAAASAVTYVLKIALGRERPDVSGSTGAFRGLSFADDQHSMPSGHTTAAFAMARVLAKNDPQHALAYYSGATLVGLTRIHLYRHWPSDVVAGALIGLSIGNVF